MINKIVSTIDKILNEGKYKVRISCLMHGLFAAFISVLLRRYIDNSLIVWSLVSLIGFSWEYILQLFIFKNSQPDQYEFIAFPTGSMVGLLFRQIAVSF